MGLIQSVEGLQWKDWDLPRKKKFCLQAAFWFKTVISPLPWVSSLPTCLADFRLAIPHNWVSKFLKIHTHTYTHGYTYILLVLLLWRSLIISRYVIQVFSPSTTRGLLLQLITLLWAQENPSLFHFSGVLKWYCARIGHHFSSRIFSLNYLVPKMPLLRSL